MIWRRRALAAAGAIVLGLALCEVGLRLFLGRQYATIYRLDPECLFALEPGASRFYRRHEVDGGEAILVSVNADGFRGPPLRERPGKRVVVYGDSFVAAEFSGVAASYPGQLAARLGADVEVVNAGVIAYGPDQVAVRLARELPALRPDLVVVGLCANNDHGDLLRNGLFTLDAAAGALVRREVTVAEPLRAAFARARGPVLLKVLDRARQRLEHASARRRWKQIQAEQAEAADLVARHLAARRAEHARWSEPGPFEVRDLFFDGWDADIAVEPESPSARAKTRLMEAVLARVRDLCAEAGVPLLLVAIPAAIDVCDDHPSGHVDPAAWPGYDRRRLTSSLAGAAGRLGVRCIDLFEPFEAAGARSLYFERDDHWNDAGQELAARLTAERIAAEGWLR